MNQNGAFEFLAPKLDEQLRSLVENAQSNWHQQWAFTRYDIVGHSQGGVLLRMLCTSDDPPGSDFQPFRSASNAYRGRFGRVITLNSPHNGSTLEYYCAKMADAGHPLEEGLRTAGLLQDKFNPFGFELLRIRNRWHTDPAAKFHFIGTTIHGGAAPAVGDSTPRSYTYTGLTVQISNENSRGSIVIPSGSDGVVDFVSEFAGIAQGDTKTIVQGTDISHSGPWPHWLFGVPDDDHIATRSDIVGSDVADLFNGSETKFDSFVSQPVNPSLETQIDAIVPEVNPNGPAIFLIFSRKSNPLKNPSSTVAVYDCGISPAANQEPALPPNWSVQVFGPDGITQDGVSVAADNDNPEIAHVSIEDTVVGDVVVYVSYTDVNGVLVSGIPIAIVSRPPGANLSGLELVPNIISLTSGSNVATEIWGDYDNGSRSRLYIPNGAAISYTSDDNAIAIVDAAGKIILNSPGATNVHVSYLGFSAQSSVTVSSFPPPPVITPLGAVSRKAHGASGTFDINLPLTGNPGIECRSGGASNSYQVIVTFAAPITLAGASVTNGIGGVSNYSMNGSELIINLTGIANAQTINVTLAGVSDGGATNDIVIPMSVLLGDTTGNGTVNSSDVSLTKLKSGQAVDASNFRADVTANGSINSSDVSTVKLKSGTALP